MKFIFLKTGDYLELEPNKSSIASAWFDYVFSKNKSKADDLSDTLCQAFAFIVLEFIE